MHWFMTTFTSPLLILIKHQAEETVGEISSEVLRELILGPGLGMALGKE